MIWLIIGLILAIGYSGYVTYLLIRKQQFIIYYERWIDIYSTKTLFIKSLMNDIDASGAFENDDEVGRVFNELNDLVQELGFGEIDAQLLSDVYSKIKEEQKLNG